MNSQPQSIPVNPSFQEGPRVFQPQGRPVNPSSQEGQRGFQPQDRPVNSSSQHVSSGFQPQGRPINSRAQQTPEFFQPDDNIFGRSTAPPPAPRKKAEILIVGTSLMNKLNKQVIQNVTDSAVKIAKAFTIESKDGVVKPELNHTDVVASELAAAKYNTMVLEGGVNEISNFDTNEDFITNINEWKRKVSEQSVKIFQLAEKRLVQNKSLQKVIILKCVFRSDNKIKESLSQLCV